MNEAYFAGFPQFCPRCTSKKITIFFVDGFLGKLRWGWKESINTKKIKLENNWKIILKCTPKRDTVGSISNPNWICKNCYDGGVVIHE